MLSALGGLNPECRGLCRVGKPSITKVHCLPRPRLVYTRKRRIFLTADRLGRDGTSGILFMLVYLFSISSAQIIACHRGSAA